MITGKLYVLLKFVAQILLPALGALYFTLAQIWCLPAAEQVVGTLVAIDALIGILLGISQSNYNKQVGAGVMRVDETGEKMTYTLELDDHPEELVNKQEVRFKVERPA